MKARAIITGIVIILMVASAGAVEWNGKFGIGLRGPVLAPLFKGEEYSNFGNSYEQFMMGWNVALDVKYGVTRNLVLNLSGGYSSTYDNTTADADQSFKLNKSDDASVQMTGIRLGLEGQYYFLPQGNIQPYLLMGIGTDLWKLERLAGRATYNFSDLGGRVGAGINFWIGESFALDLQGKLTYDLASISADEQAGFYGQVDWSDYKTRPFGGYLEPSVGFTYFFGGARDTDQDGIKDKFDQCPDTPVGALVDQYGCPLDSDGDGVYDGLDACVETPTGAVVDITGCPLDTDEDGIFDGLDKCPNTPLEVAVDVRGCPLDTDGDGVPDFKDKEANTPAGAVVDADGVALDADGDDVPDGIDKCPDTPVAVLVDELGCPLAKPLTEKIVLNIKYAPGSFQPDKEARMVLDEIVETMRAYPNLTIEVNGYTDALGSATGNLKLSQKRADAVMGYLRDQGVAAERLTAQGYGEDPKFFVGDNSTEEGRQKNRRVEIVPVQQ